MIDARQVFRPNTEAGGVDLTEIPIVDIQVHPMSLQRLASVLKRGDAIKPVGDCADKIPQHDPALVRPWSRLCAAWVQDLIDFHLPPGDFPTSDAVRAAVRGGASVQAVRSPRKIGYEAYVAQVHETVPSEEAIDAIVAPNLVSDEAFAAYIERVMDREKIASVIVQAPDLAFEARLDETSTRLPDNLFPPRRTRWTFSFLTLLDPAWASANDARSIAEVTTLIDEVMEAAVKNGCVGFKSNGAYTRSFEIHRVSALDAELALQALFSYDRPERGVDSLRIYQDFLIRHICIRAGELRRPILWHVAVAFNPALRIEFNDPAPLYDMFRDPEIRAAGTCFVLKNTGYPVQDIVTAMASQFPNVYVDVTFFTQYAAGVDNLYRGLLSIAPSEKILYGSDISDLPEGIAYAAWTTRVVLSRILRDFETQYNWPLPDIRRAAHNILHENSERLFDIRI